ncbi:MAG: S41 family peptidase [Planctomycetota bacterium]|nr:S41 family peptidase [Planctomycetota bacterium]
MLRRECLLVFLSPLVLVAIGVGFVQVSRNAGTRRAEEVPGEALYEEVLRTVRERYVLEPDQERLVYGAARGIMAELDRHSRIYDDGEWADHNLRSAGKYAGVGILVGKLRGKLSVLEAMPEGPAERSGIRHGDRILAIDGKPVDDARPLSDYLGQLRGSTGSTVVLTVAALGTTTDRQVEIRRGLTPERLVYGYVLDADPSVGYINVESFRETTVALFDDAVETLLAAGAESLIMDLRGNLGGSLDAAIKLADRFIPEGLLVTTEGRVPSHPRYASSSTPYADVPLVVLVDGHSASASEILAGALQDHSRAVLLGERTFGKGVVQEVSAFRSGWQGGMKITTAHYFTPAGRCIERSIGLRRDRQRRGGLVPDVSVRMTPAFASSRDRDAWYLALGQHRQLGRYAARVRKILGEQRPAFDDRHVGQALALLSARWNGDRSLTE